MRCRHDNIEQARRHGNLRATVFASLLPVPPVNNSGSKTPGGAGTHTGKVKFRKKRVSAARPCVCEAALS